MKNKKRHSIFGKILFSLALIPAVMLVLCLLIKVVPPSVAYLPSLLGYVFVPLLAVNLVLFLLYAFALQARCLVFAACILVNITNIQDVVQFKGRPEKRGWRSLSAPRLKILSYNVRLFDFYNELQHKDGKASPQGDIKPQLLAFLEDADADIVCLQEFYEPFSPSLPASEILAKAGYKYKTPATKGKKGYYGNRIYSRLPIISHGLVDLLSIENAVYADILVGDEGRSDTLRVYNIHLASFLFDGKDAAFLSSLTSSRQSGDIYKEGSKRVLRKMKRSTLRREKQVKAVLEHAMGDGVPSRVLLCGDMNEQPTSYTRAQLRKAGFEDAFVKAGKGVGQTYQGKFPSFRIDYIFSKGLEEPLFFDTYKVEYSDHRPVSAVF